MRTLQAVTAAVVLFALAGCSNGSDAQAAREAAQSAAKDRAAVEVLASQAATDRAAAERLAEETAAEQKVDPPATAVSVPPAAAPPRPVAVGNGLPNCNGVCTVDSQLARSFLPQFGGEQTLLLASGSEPDESGGMLHAFLVDDQGRVLWEEHGFGFLWRPVDERFNIRWDEAGHTFFRAFVADFTYLYVLDTSTGTPRLVGSPDGTPDEGFQLGEVVTRPGQSAFDIRETLVDCPEGDDVYSPETCTEYDVVRRWDGQRYVTR